MKAYVVYDSLHGNTELVAEAIARGLRVVGDVEICHSGKDIEERLHAGDMLVVGAPTQKGRATRSVISFVDRLSAATLDGLRVATFDTRLPRDSRGRRRGIVSRTFGYAAPKIAKDLTSKGADLVATPEGFIINGKEGPAKKGELERAEAWAAQLATSAFHPSLKPKERLAL